MALVRMQADSMKAAESRRGYRHVGDALLRIYKEEGRHFRHAYLLRSHIYCSCYVLL